MLWLSVTTKAAWRLQRLLKAKLIQREKSIIGKYIYCNKGFKGLDIANYDHDQQVKRLAVAESKRLNCEYVTVRQMWREARKEKGILGLSKKVPDLLLVKDGRKIAVELELSQKSMQQQSKNIDKYIKQLLDNEYEQIYYYCSTDTIKDRINILVTEKGISGKIRAILYKQV